MVRAHPPLLPLGGSRLPRGAGPPEGPATLLRPAGGASACRGADERSIHSSHGKDRSQSRNHARLHRVQAAQLPDARSRSGTRPTASSSRSTAAGADRTRRIGRRASHGPRSRSRPAESADRRLSSRRRGRGRVAKRNFIFESWAELKKVEWPNQNQVIQGTVVVLVACAIAGVYLWLNDQLWKEVVQRLILGQ